MGSEDRSPAPRVRQVGLQFHAEGPEAVLMVAGWAREFALAAVLGQFFADRLVEVRANDFGTALTAMPAPTFVLLNRRPLRVRENLTFLRLAEANPGSLILELGQRVSEGQRESALGAITADPDDFRLWRRLVDRARRSMLRGAVVTDPMTAATQRSPSHRYTAEALRLQTTGVPMLALGGWVTYELGLDQKE